MSHSKSIWSHLKKERVRYVFLITPQIWTNTLFSVSLCCHLRWIFRTFSIFLLLLISMNSTAPCSVSGKHNIRWHAAANLNSEVEERLVCLLLSSFVYLSSKHKASSEVSLWFPGARSHHIHHGLFDVFPPSMDGLSPEHLVWPFTAAPTDMETCSWATYELKHTHIPCSPHTDLTVLWKRVSVDCKSKKIRHGKCHRPAVCVYMLHTSCTSVWFTAVAWCYFSLYCYF